MDGESLIGPDMIGVPRNTRERCAQDGRDH